MTIQNRIYQSMVKGISPLNEDWMDPSGQPTLMPGQKKPVPITPETRPDLFGPDDTYGDPDGDGIPNWEDDDDDGDGIPDMYDPDHPDYDPYHPDWDPSQGYPRYKPGIIPPGPMYPEPPPPDQDDDGIPDTEDDDTDGDGIPNWQDPDSDKYRPLRLDPQQFPAPPPGPHHPPEMHPPDPIEDHEWEDPMETLRRWWEWLRKKPHQR
jgi:hypothetical protein